MRIRVGKGENMIKINFNKINKNMLSNILGPKQIITSCSQLYVCFLDGWVDG